MRNGEGPKPAKQTQAPSTRVTPSGGMAAASLIWLARQRAAGKRIIVLDPKPEHRLLLDAAFSHPIRCHTCGALGRGTTSLTRLPERAAD